MTELHRSSYQRERDIFCVTGSRRRVAPMYKGRMTLPRLSFESLFQLSIQDRTIKTLQLH